MTARTADTSDLARLQQEAASPMDATVKAGDCARGGIMFPVQKGERPDRVVYAPEGDEVGLEWKVPEKG